MPSPLVIQATAGAGTASSVTPSPAALGHASGISASGVLSARLREFHSWSAAEAIRLEKLVYSLTEENLWLRKQLALQAGSVNGYNTGIISLDAAPSGAVDDVPTVDVRECETLHNASLVSSPSGRLRQPLHQDEDFEEPEQPVLEPEAVDKNSKLAKSSQIYQSGQPRASNRTSHTGGHRNIRTSHTAGPRTVKSVSLESDNPEPRMRGSTAVVRSSDVSTLKVRDSDVAASSSRDGTSVSFAKEVQRHSMQGSRLSSVSSHYSREASQYSREDGALRVSEPPARPSAQGRRSVDADARSSAQSGGSSSSWLDVIKQTSSFVSGIHSISEMVSRMSSGVKSTVSTNARRFMRQQSKMSVITTSSKATRSSHWSINRSGGYKLHPVWRDMQDEYDGEDPHMDATMTSMSAVDDTKFQKLMQELQQSGQRSSFVINPTSRFCVAWDIIFMLVMLYDFIWIPYQQAFEPKEIPWSLVFQWFSRIFWTMSIPLSMITGYISQDGTIEVRRNKILRVYLKTWGTFDVLVVLTDWLALIFEGLQIVNSVAVMKSLRIMRALRVLRLAKTFKMPGQLALVMKRSYFEQVQLVINVFKMFIVMMGIVHLIACFWYAVGGGTPGWVEFWGYEDRHLSWRYAISFHWAMTQFIGNCEVFPETEGERYFAISMLAICFFASTCFVSEVTASLTRLSIITGHNSRRFSQLRQYLDSHKISPSLAVRVTRSAKYLMMQEERDMPEDAVELLSMISEPLLMEIHYEVNVPILTQHPFFRRYHHMCQVAVRKICHSANTHFTLSAGDLLFSEGEKPAMPRMFFVTSGTLFYMQVGTEDSLSLCAGEWACEMSAWVAWTHLGTMRAATNCNLVSLNVTAFQKIAREFREPIFYPAVYARDIHGVLNDNFFDRQQGYGGSGGTHGSRYSANSEEMGGSLVSGEIRGSFASEEDLVQEINDVSYGPMDIASIVRKVFPHHLQRRSSNVSLTGILSQMESEKDSQEDSGRQMPSVFSSVSEE